MAVTPEAARRGGGFGTRARLSIVLQVTLVLGLALGATVLAIELAAWGPLRARVDLTLRGRNTLDPALDRLLAQLPRKVTAETFFQPLPGQLQPLWIEARTRALDVLGLASRAHPERFDLIAREREGLEAMRDRMTELGLREEGGNTVVVSAGERREVLRLFGDLAVLDQRPGQELRVSEHRTELALAEALSAVSLAGAPRILFSTGHGEPSVLGTGPLELDRLRRALEADGFEVEPWDLEAGEPLPADCEVFALVGPADPLGEAASAELREWVEGGGRLLVALGNVARADRAGDAAELLAGFGMRLQPGIVCHPVLDSFGNAVEGLPQVAYLRVGPDGMSSQHPVTRPLYERRRRVLVHNSRWFERGSAPPGGVLLDLLRSPEDAWADLPQAGRHDWALDQFRETAGPFRLALSAQFPPGGLVDVAALDSGEEIPEARVLGLAGLEVLANENLETNRDFVLNAFNWLSAREFRLNVSILDPEESRVDLRRGQALPWIHRVGVWGLPGLCALLGVVTAWLRRR